MEFYYYIPIVSLVVASTIVGVRSYLRERRENKRREALKQDKGTVHG